MKESMVRVLRPGFVREVKGRINIPTMRDYIEVPRLSQYGTAKVSELLASHELLMLFQAQRMLESGQKDLTSCRVRRFHARDDSMWTRSVRKGLLK